MSDDSSQHRDPAPLRDRLRARTERLGIPLSPEQLDRLERYHALLTRWNRAVNLTGLQLDPLTDIALDRLLTEPLVASKWVDALPIRWLDLGSGGGSPAIPLKVVRPSTSLTMVEAHARKAAFLRAAIRELRLSQAAVVNARFESLAAERTFAGTAELVTARAVRVDRVLAAVRGLLASTGKLLIFSSASVLRQFSPLETVEVVELIPGSSSRLFILKKLTAS
jgi:16S rRNA (guanine527-N7)-methyltransferase